MAVLTEVVSWVFVLTSVTYSSALIDADAFEVGLWIERVSGAVGLTDGTGSESSSCTETATGVAESAFVSRCICVVVIGTDCQTAAVRVEVVKVGGTRSCIETFLGVVLAGFTFGTAGLAYVQDVGIDELADRAAGSAGVDSNMFVVWSLGCDC